MIIVQIKQITTIRPYHTKQFCLLCVLCGMAILYHAFCLVSTALCVFLVWFCLLCTKSGGVVWILLERIIECIGPRHGAKKELAEHLGIHPNVITNWLNGRNKSYRRYVNEIAAFYGVSVDYLLGNVDSKEKQPDSQNENQAVKDELIAFYGDVKDDLNSR